MENEESEASIRQLVEENAPEFARVCKMSFTDHVVMDQNTFVSGCRVPELYYLGALIRYAGFYGKDVLIHRKQGEKVSEKNQAPSFLRMRPEKN